MIRKLEFIILLLLVFFDAIFSEFIIYEGWMQNISITRDSEKFRAMDYIDNVESTAKQAEKLEMDFGTLSIVKYVSKDENNYLRIRDYLIKTNYYDMKYASDILNGIYKSIKYFPVAKGSITKDFICYEDTYLEERNYNGRRFHEGIDIMPLKDESGVYPIISICDGTVENIGWLTLGGYRIGIRSDYGIYFYYAHLHSYFGELKEGDRVQAGDIIGLMGDTGYGNPGTVGQFPVHLHLGIYYNNEKGDEISINPWIYLKYLEGNILKYTY